MDGQISQSNAANLVVDDEDEYSVIEQLVCLHRDVADHPGRTIEEHLDYFYPPPELEVDERATQLADAWPDSLLQLVDNTVFVGLEHRSNPNSLAAYRSKATDLPTWPEEVRALWPDESSSSEGGDWAIQAWINNNQDAEEPADTDDAENALVPVDLASLAPPAVSFGFTPTNMARFGPGRVQPPTPQEQALRQMTGMSPNYHGDVHNVFNHSLNDLPDEENCSFWVSKLPPDVEIYEITDRIRRCGRLAVVQITKAQADRWGAGAKITFFDVHAAQDFYRRFVIFEDIDDPAHSGGIAGHLIVRGRKASIVRNNVKVAQNTAPAHHSRVIRVTGPRWYVQVETILNVLRGKFVFQMERIIDHSTPTTGDLEFRFARYQEQAKFAILALFSELEENPRLHRSLRQIVTIRYWDDPCDRGV